MADTHNGDEARDMAREDMDAAPDSPETPKNSRRTFLRKIGLAAGAAGLAHFVPLGQPKALAIIADCASPSEDSCGYPSSSISDACIPFFPDTCAGDGSSPADSCGSGGTFSSEDQCYPSNPGESHDQCLGDGEGDDVDVCVYPYDSISGGDNCIYGYGDVCQSNDTPSG